jgi:hypothetical protein
LDFETFKAILYHGYSRIPVYEHSKENFVGMILIQDLLLNDPADKVPLKAVLDYYKHPVLRCRLSESLEPLLDKLRKGASHMAFVYSDEAIFHEDNNNNNTRLDDLRSERKEENYSTGRLLTITTNSDHELEAVGILTLENIIEALVDEEIMDEADTKREKRKRRAKEALKGKLANLSISNENLNIFVKEVDQTNKPVISTQIKKALFYFLASSKTLFFFFLILNGKVLKFLLDLKRKEHLYNPRHTLKLYFYVISLQSFACIF